MDGTSRGRHNSTLGRYGEEVAARFLAEQRGMTVLDRNWRCPEGEIDLVLRDGGVLVVCEVKTRTSLAHGTPHEAVDDRKLARLRRLGIAWVRAHGVRAPDIRVDLVAVLRRRTGAPVVDHVRGMA